MPNTGAVKLKENIERDKSIEFKVGRDWLFSLLREKKMLLYKKKRYVKTTNSSHHLKVYRNEIKSLKDKERALILVSDITYIPTEEGSAYLFLLTEMNSKKILGYSFRNNLQMEGAIDALKMALSYLPHTEKRKIYHHSDRGMQYCGKDYIEILKQNKIIISMTEENHCYENAVAERVNGILKEEFIGYKPLPNFQYADSLTRESILLYNSKRIHQSIGYLTPDECFYNKKPVNLF